MMMSAIKKMKLLDEMECTAPEKATTKSKDIRYAEPTAEKLP